MSQIHGDLLIGGAVLRHLDLELLIDEPILNTSDRLLSGRISLSAAQNTLLEIGRRYRLQLEDGRAGAIVVSGKCGESDGAHVLEFAPLVPAFRAS